MFASTIPYEFSYTHERLQTKQKHKTVICTPDVVASLSFVNVQNPKPNPAPSDSQSSGRGMALTMEISFMFADYGQPSQPAQPSFVEIPNPRVTTTIGRMEVTDVRSETVIGRLLDD